VIVKPRRAFPQKKLGGTSYRGLETAPITIKGLRALRLCEQFPDSFPRGQGMPCHYKNRDRDVAPTKGQTQFTPTKQNSLCELCEN